MGKKSEYTPLDYDPFAGDDGEERVLQDAMVKARKQNKCFHCADTINVGDIHRARRAVYEDEMMSWRWCAACCAAMVVEMNATGGSDTYEADRNAFESRAATMDSYYA